MNEQETQDSALPGAIRTGWFNRHMTCLRRRKVSRVAITYSLIVWLIVQIGDVCFPLLEISDSMMLYIVLAAVLGLPLAMFLAWLFEITPNGIVLDRSHNSHAHSEPAELVVNTAFLLIAALIAWFMVLRIMGSDSVLADDGIRSAKGMSAEESIARESEILCVTLGMRDGQLEITSAKAPGADATCLPVRLRGPAPQG